MNLPIIEAEPCNCRGDCQDGLTDKTRCVKYLARKTGKKIKVMFCRKCGSGGWHIAGKCIRCMYLNGEEIEGR